MSLKIISPSTVYLGSAESGSGGGGKQVTLLSVTTAPSGTFEKGSQYYDSTDRVIYTAVDDNTWTGATTSTPEFGVIYIYDNNGSTEYYQWDGDNLVETDLEKYQLVANKSDDFTESSKNKYPSSFALYQGLESVRPNEVTNSGASLPSASDFQEGDTFLNTSDNKIYRIVESGKTYKLNSNTFSSGVGGTASLSINTSSGVISGFSSDSLGYNYIYRKGLDLRWIGVKEYKIHFKANTGVKRQIFNIVNYTSYDNSGMHFDSISFIIYQAKIHIQAYHLDSHMGSASWTTIKSPVLLLDTILSNDTEYFLTIKKKENGLVEASISSTSYTENIIETKSVETGINDVNSYEDTAYIYYGMSTIPSSTYMNTFINNYGYNFDYGSIYALDSVGEFLTTDTIIYSWDSGTDLTDKTEYVDKTNGILYFYKNSELVAINTPSSFASITGNATDNTSLVNALNTKQDKSLSFTNVSASSWVADNTYADYGYKCDISCTGVTSSMYAMVNFAPTEADSGNYATVCNTGTDIVTIYSKVNDTITIPSIVVMGV